MHSNIDFDNGYKTLSSFYSVSNYGWANSFEVDPTSDFKNKSLPFSEQPYIDESLDFYVYVNAQEESLFKGLERIVNSRLSEIIKTEAQLDFVVETMPKRVDRLINRIKSGSYNYSDNLRALAKKAAEANPDADF